jgi:DNA-binding response OmpR family regulator
MTNLPDPTAKRILVIDRQKDWRISTADFLRGLGFLVKESESYEYTSAMAQIEDQAADLIILGCAVVKKEEQELIGKILNDRHHLLVFSASLPWADMRSVFLAGADDVTNKTYDHSRLRKAVTDVLANLAARSSFELVDRKA